MSIKIKTILLNILTLLTLVSVVCFVLASSSEWSYDNKTSLQTAISVFASGAIFMVMLIMVLAVVVRDKAKKELNNQQNLILYKTATRTFYIFGTIAVLAVIYWIFFMINTYIGLSRIEW
jgi:amino acid transporter